MILYESNIWNISDMGEVFKVRMNTPSFSSFETFASNQPFTCNYHQTIKIWDNRNILWRIEMNV